MSCLNQALRAALDQRQDLLAELHAQGTDCYRLFHGSQEGIGGLTIDSPSTATAHNCWYRASTSRWTAKHC